MSVLITGASGFIGWHLAKSLQERGEQVRGLVRSTSQVDALEDLGVELVYGDITDRESLLAATKDATTVYHLAGLTKALDNRRLEQVNVAGTSNVAFACTTNGVQRLVCASSLAAAGPARDGSAQTESCPAEPVSNYGHSKRQAEDRLRKFAADLSVSIVRPPIVFGEYDRATLEMFKSIHNWRLHVVPTIGWSGSAGGSRQPPFSIVHATDLAHCLIAVAERGERLDSTQSPGHGIYFVECEQRPTYTEIGDLIGASLGRRVLKLPLGPPALRLGGFVADQIARVRGDSLYFSSDKVREATTGPWTCSATKAAEQLQYQPAVPLAERFEQTARWYLENGWL